MINIRCAHEILTYRTVAGRLKPQRDLGNNLVAGIRIRFSSLCNRRLPTTSLGVSSPLEVPTTGPPA